MKRVLHIVYESSYGGVVTVIRGIVRNLPEYEHKILAVVKGAAHEELISAGVDTDYLFDCSKRKLIRSLKTPVLWGYLDGNSFDIIHYHTGGFTILLCAYMFRKNARVIHHIHSGNITGRKDGDKNSFWQNCILKFLNSRTVQIAVSDIIAAQYKRVTGRSANLKVIKNYADPVQSSRKGFTYRIGYVNRMTVQKGFVEVLRLAGEIKKRNLPYRVKVKCEIPEDSEFKRENLFTFIEYENPSLDTNLFYQSIDLLLFPSTLPEGCPLVLLEAAASGVAVIALKTKAVSEIMGEYPLLVDAFDVDTVLDQISQFYRSADLRKRLEQLHSEILSEYNQAKSTPLLKTVYEIC